MTEPDRPDAPTPAAPLLAIRDLRVHFPVTGGGLLRRRVGAVKAVDGVSLDVRAGEAVGLVGESGCGKTTLARAVLGLEAPTEGRIELDGADLAAMTGAARKAMRRRVQAVFQDPMSSLSPRMRVAEIVAEPLAVHHPRMPAAERSARVSRLLDLCGLPRRFAELFPHEMSGGQRQRVGIARSLALEPELIVLDEAVSALDVSIQAQVINLLRRLRGELGLAYLFIGHDLSVVRHLCDRVAVMYLGRVVEEADSEGLFAAPLHPYTRALIDAAPVPDPAAEAARPHQGLGGEPPSPMNPPPGCAFNPRCPLAFDRCRAEAPRLERLAPGHSAACFAAEVPAPPAAAEAEA
jgi:oligopeptide/dipeptide ABC transporter ATP-binding protein